MIRRGAKSKGAAQRAWWTGEMGSLCAALAVDGAANRHATLSSFLALLRALLVAADTPTRARQLSPYVEWVVGTVLPEVDAMRFAAPQDRWKVCV